MHLRSRAVCVVANTRNSDGYCCVLRLAPHPDPQRTLAARFVQKIPSAFWISARSYEKSSGPAFNLVLMGLFFWVPQSIDGFKRVGHLDVQVICFIACEMCSDRWRGGSKTQPVWNEASCALLLGVGHRIVRDAALIARTAVFKINRR